MTKFVVGRLIAMVLILLLLTAVVFVLRTQTPANPVRQVVGAMSPRGAIERVEQELGLDRPLPIQYVDYVGDVVQGDFQTSLRTRQPVRDDLSRFLPASAELVLIAGFLMLVGAAALGFAGAANWRNSGSLRGVMVAGASVPAFLLAYLLILVFSRWLGWLPTTGRTSFRDAVQGPTGLLTFDSLLAGRLDVFWDAVLHLAIPVTVLAILSAVIVGRVFRGSLRATLSSNYVRTARAKGLSERTVLFRHAARNSVGPALSMAGLQVGIMFAVLVIVEKIFAWPGIGSYVAQSITTNDYPVIAAVTLLVGAAYVLVNGLVDILQAAADPRIRSASR